MEENEVGLNVLDKRFIHLTRFYKTKYYHVYYVSRCQSKKNRYVTLMRYAVDDTSLETSAARRRRDLRESELHHRRRL